MSETETISFLPQLDAMEPRTDWLFPDMESKANENGVYCYDVRQYRKGTWNRWSVELTIAAVGDRIYYEFGYTSGPDNYYGRYSPLDEDSDWCHRNNGVAMLRQSICDTFRNSRLENDGNLSPNSRKELWKLMRQICEEVTR